MQVSAKEKTNGNLKKNRMLDVDYRAIVSRANLVYLSPAGKAFEGQPVGNGRMGTMVWTTPGAIHLQINRNDVFAVNKNYDGRPHYAEVPHGHPHWTEFPQAAADYCGACAQITIDVGGEPFSGKRGEFRQQLSLYEAEDSVVGKGIYVRCFVSAAMDVFVLEIDDQRLKPQPIQVKVYMCRAPEVKTGAHVARYEFVEIVNKLLVVQRFKQKDYYCASAVAVEVLRSETKMPPSSDDHARTIIASPKKGKRTILISSTASWSPRINVGTAAIKLLKKASEQPYHDLREKHMGWWSAFWSRSTFVHLSSADGVADFVEQLRTLHLYFMASSSRGTLPPKWNGGLFFTNGDNRRWGSQFWIWTTEMLYFSLFAADAINLTEPYFNMYLKQLPDCKKAAEQRWGVKGAFYPETMPFDGPVVLPEDVVQEFQNYFLGRRTSKLSKRVQTLCQFEGHLYSVAADEPRTGRYSFITHIATSGSKLALQAWWRYRYTGDIGWLRTHAYPLLRETVEFYRHLVQRGEDGRYHIHGTNAHEDFWGVKDSIIDLAAIRGTAPLAIQAAKILKVDKEMCAKWKELLDNLAPYPTGSEPQSMALTGGVLAGDVWAAGHLGDVDGSHNAEDIWLNPIFPFEDWTLETRDPETDRIVQKALNLAPRLSKILNGDDNCTTSIRTPIVCSRAGQGDKLPSVLVSYYAAFSPLPNGLSLFEGWQDSSSEHLGCISMTVQEGLLQSVSARPGEPEVINVLPAWPKEWDASFRLLARGGFLVTASVRNGKLEFVEIESRLGEPCRLRNPWKKPCLVTEIGGVAQELNSDILCFKTGRGRSYLVLPKGRPAPKRRRLSPKPSIGPVSFSYMLLNEKILKIKHS